MDIDLLDLEQQLGQEADEEAFAEITPFINTKCRRRKKRPKEKAPPAPPKFKPNEYRAMLMMQGYSLRGWAIERGYCVATLSMAINGKRNGQTSQKMRSEIEELA